MNKNTKMIRWMAGNGILAALVVVLGIISNHVTIGIVNINLALIPIVVGACIYGPLSGLFLGAVDGIVIFFAPATISYFWPVNIILCLLLCIIKTGLAGLFAGCLYYLIHKKNSYVGSTVAALVTPIINTGIFLVGTIFFFLSVYGDSVSALIKGVITINFAIEFTVSVLLSPAVHKIIKIVTRNMDIGDIYDEDDGSKTSETAETETSDNN